jgi:hypothetical protein
MDDSDPAAGYDLDRSKDPNQRTTRDQLGSATRTARVLNGIAWPVFLWGWFFPRPYPLAIAALAILPLVAIMLVVWSNGLYVVVGIRGDRRPRLDVLFFGCGMVLCIRAVEDIGLFQRALPVVPAIIFGCGLMLVALVRDRRMWEGSWALVWLTAILYSYGAIVQANTLFDSSKPQIFEANVVGKRSYGSALHTAWWYYLRLSAWGPRREVNDLFVPSALYHSVLPGQKVCVSVYPGALKIHWFSVRECQ